MQFQALTHMAAAASGLVPDVKIIVFGSASAFATFPDLGECTGLYENTNDADFIIDPWSDDLCLMLSKCLGKDSSFFQMFGYYADIVRPAAFDNFPPDFRDRLVPLEGCPRVFALDPHDMAVAKLFAGRPKDVRLLSFLLATDRLDEAKVRKLLWDTPMEEKWIVRTHQVLDLVVAEAAQQKEAGSTHLSGPEA